MVKCPNCGAYNNDASRFCVQCGTRLPPGVAESSTSSLGGSSPPAGESRARPAPTLPDPIEADPIEADPVEAALADNSEAAGPDLTATRQGLTAARPGLTAAWPDLTAARPDLTAARPDLTAARPGEVRSSLKPTHSGFPTPSSAPSSPSSVPAGFAGSPVYRPARPTAVGVGDLDADEELPDPAMSLSDAIARASSPSPAADPADASPPTKASPSTEPGPSIEVSPLTAADVPAPEPTEPTPTEPESTKTSDTLLDEPLAFDGPSRSPRVSSGFPPKRPVSLDDTELPFGDLLDEVDTGFERIVEQPTPSTTDASSKDLREVHDLFAEIAATHMGPVRDFIIELKLGEPAREWVELVLPAVSTLRKSADRMKLAALCENLDSFLSALEVASSLGEPTLVDEARDRLLTSYGALVDALPQAFALDEERDRREPVIVQSLLQQIPEVRKVALDKLYGAGLTSLEMYYVAKPYDIAEAAGIPTHLAARIVERFASYKREIASVPDANRSREYGQLDELSRRLREQNAAYEVASKGWSRGAARDKRRLRKERQETLLQLNVVLARLGEVDLVSQLERLPFSAKVETLDEFLQEAKSSRRPNVGDGKRT